MTDFQGAVRLKWIVSDILNERVYLAKDIIMLLKFNCLEFQIAIKNGHGFKVTRVF